MTAASFPAAGAAPAERHAFAVRPEPWDALFRAIVDERGIARDLPVWRFLFPAKGDEPAVSEPLVKVP